MWERSFVAVRVLVGQPPAPGAAGPLEEALASLPEGADVTDLVAKLRDGRRAVRAAALAVAAQEVAIALNDVTLAYRAAPETP